MAAGGSTQHHAMFNPNSNSASNLASVIVLYNPNTLQPVQTFVFTHIGSYPVNGMLSFSMDYWNSRTIAASFKIGVSADIGFGVFNPDGTSDYAIISAVNDCNNTARAIMESSVDLWIYYTECGGSDPTQLIHIVYDLSQAVGSKFTYPERY